MNNNCNHFWELIFPFREKGKQTWECMYCGKRKKMDIPILDENIFNEPKLEKPQTFTIEEIRNYIKSQDSLNDAICNLSAVNILASSKKLEAE